MAYAAYYHSVFAESSNRSHCTGVISLFLCVHSLVLIVIKYLKNRGYIMFSLITFSRRGNEGQLAPSWGICCWRSGAEDKPTSVFSLSFVPSPRVWTLWGRWRCDDDTFTQLLLYGHAQSTNPGCLFRELTLLHSTHHLSCFLLYVLAYGGTKWSIFFSLPRLAKITSRNLCFPVFA